MSALAHEPAAQASAQFTEAPLIFPGGDAGQGSLVGVETVPAGRTPALLGVVVVVGGPQTRVGSHRQFVLLARGLAARGIAVLRFDYAGMGDSAGPLPDFERAAGDIRAATDVLLSRHPGMRGVMLWGLCDGAAAALLHAPHDPRVLGVIGANPWARSPRTQAAAIASTHYRAQLRSGRFWLRLLRGEVAIASALRSAVGIVLQARRRDAPARDGNTPAPLPTRLQAAIGALRVPVRFLLCPADLTGAEFEQVMAPAGLLARDGVSTLRFEGADHTFSNREDWQRAVDASADFVLASAGAHG